MTRIFQIGLLTEAFLNISGSLVFILYPSWCLSFILASPTGSTSGNQSQQPEAAVPTSAAVLWQVYGGLVLALTLPILLVVPETGPRTSSNAIYGKRDIVFKTFVAGEVILIALLTWNASKPEAASGFGRVGLLTMVAFLFPALAWHSYALWVRPDLMGPEDNDGKRSIAARKRL